MAARFLLRWWRYIFFHIKSAKNNEEHVFDHEWRTRSVTSAVLTVYCPSCTRVYVPTHISHTFFILSQPLCGVICATCACSDFIWISGPTREVAGRSWLLVDLCTSTLHVDSTSAIINGCSAGWLQCDSAAIRFWLMWIATAEKNRRTSGRRRLSIAR